MPDELSPSTLADDRFEHALAELLQAEERGEPLDLSRVLQTAPELETPLRAFFRNRDGFDRFAPHLAPTAAGPGAPAPLPDSRFGDYQILGELGRGGMGVVYHARQRAPEREVALKVIRADRLADLTPEEARHWLDRFRRESELVAGLEQHPNLVTLYEVGEHEGRAFFTMQLIAGSSLAHRLASEPRRSDTEAFRAAARLIATVARAVHHAHQHGIMHRDLKPANILLDAKGEPHVTDFGLAKRVESTSKMTQSGAILGTPSYMAPEQARGAKGLSTAVDVYSLGAILYELLTGRAPFSATTPMDTLLQVLEQEPVPPRKVEPRVDRDLETICLKCLSKDPAKRYGSAEALAEDLERRLRGEPILARSAGRIERVVKWVRRRPALATLLAVSVVAVVALLGGGTFLTLRLQRALRHGNWLLADIRIQLAGTALRDGDAATAGDMLDEVPPEERHWDWRYLNRVDGKLLTLRGHTGPVQSVAFSPDGSRLASGSDDRTVKIWDTQTGKEILTLRGHVHLKPTVASGYERIGISTARGSVRSVAFSPDGTRLASGSNDSSVKIWDVPTGEEILTLNHHTSAVTSVAFSPDGAQLASGSWDGKVKVSNARTGEQLLQIDAEWVKHPGGIGEIPQSVLSVSYSPNGAWLASGGGWMLDGTAPRSQFGPIATQLAVWDARTGQQLWQTLAVTTPPPGFPSVSFSPDASRLASGRSDGAVIVYDPHSGKELLTLSGHAKGVTSVAFSPDGARLASGSSDGIVRFWDARTGKELRAFKGHIGSVNGVAFSPDGTRLASGSNDGSVRVWDTRIRQQLIIVKGQAKPVIRDASDPDDVLAAIGSLGPDGIPKVWTDAVNRNDDQFSPDSTRRAVTWGNEVKLMATRSGEEDYQQVPAFLTGHADAVTCVAFSPHSQQLASAARDGTVRVWDARNGHELLTLRGHLDQVTSVVFSPDGPRLASAGSDRTVRVWDTRTGQQVLVLRGHTSPVISLAFSPDGAFLASADEKEVRVWDGRTSKHSVPGR
jgi:WD40 repeat protein